MTGKQLLDAFSETLMQDERILSPRERELLLSLLQNSKTIAGQNSAVQTAVTETVARSVGETVAQRAFVLLGGSIVEQILMRSGIATGTEETLPDVVARKVPQPPGVRRPPDKDQPQPPGPQPPNAPGVRRPPDKDLPVGPQPPNAQRARPLTVVQEASQSDSSRKVGVLAEPAVVQAQCVVLDEFLAPQELDELVSYALQHEAEFQTSELISPSGDPGVVDYNHRRSRVLMDLGKQENVILERIKCVLPRVLDKLEIEEFPVTYTEAQITASNDGDFFGTHCDDAQEMISSRRLTFVYFFHREPRRFEGGELRLHDSHGSSRTGGYQVIRPQQNQIVFFPCSVLHEITLIQCPSRAFADSRFTLNGWLHN
jgi:SM-20-related protein